jgi:hypothetical protein
MELVRTSKFPILKNDGILALVLIFSDRNPDTKEVLFKGIQKRAIATSMIQSNYFDI